MATRSFFGESLNPFNDIIENNKTPHARTLRTSWWQKIKDTFFVFHGGGARTMTQHMSVFLTTSPCLAQLLQKKCYFK